VSGRPRTGRRPTRLSGDLGGAFGDLGTFLPYALGAITVAGIAPFGILFGFGIFLIASGLFYGLPMAVQPMKAVAAVLVTEGLDAGELAAAGVVLGLVMLVLGMTGVIARIARVIPQSITAGLQLGLGLTMGSLGLELLSGQPWYGMAMLALLLVLMRVPRCPAAPLAVLLAVLAGWMTGLVSPPGHIAHGWQWPAPSLPSWESFPHAIGAAVLPQIPLTLTNAVIVTAALSRDLFPRQSARVTERNLSLSTGLANLLLAPLGAMPMCHGAGGLQAQYRFGARTGAAPALLGALLLILAFGFSAAAAEILAMVPLPAVGALLLVAGADLALSRRLFDARPACWPAIGLTALLTVLFNPAVALAGGWALEFLRGQVMRAPTRDPR